MNSTNYYDTFIEIAEDCPVAIAEAPAMKAGKKSVAVMQYEMLIDKPYEYTSDDVLSSVDAERKGTSKEEFLSKGQPCFRASPLTKRYGWGVHSNANGKIALYPVESEQYRNYSKDSKLKHLKAMRSKRA